jgi:hypothetical protein
MHKAEIEEAFKHGKLPLLFGQVQTAEQYYKETFDSKGSDAKDVVLGYKTSLDAQMLDSQLPQQNVEKEMFELEQQLDIPSHMRWYNREELKQETTLKEAAEWLNKKFNGKGVEVKIIDWGKNEMYNYNPTKLLEEYSKWQEENSKSLSDKWKEYQDWLNEHPEDKLVEKTYTEEQLKLAYVQGYNRGVDGNPNHMEEYITHLKSTKTPDVEISDEEIEAQAKLKYPYNILKDNDIKAMIISAQRGAWVDAIRWYREQLKTKL